MTTPCTETKRLQSIEAAVGEIKKSIGDAPDLSTGSEGHGMARTLADLYVAFHGHLEKIDASITLAKTQADARVRTTKIIATAVTTAISTIAGIVAAIYASGGAP